MSTTSLPEYSMMNSESDNAHTMTGFDVDEFIRELFDSRF